MCKLEYICIVYIANTGVILEFQIPLFLQDILFLITQTKFVIRIIYIQVIDLDV